MPKQRLSIRRYNFHEEKSHQFYSIAEQVFNYGSPWTEDQYEETLARDMLVFFVAEIDNRLIGYIGGQLLFSEGEIYTLAVSEDFQKQRVAYHLLERFKEECEEQGSRTIFLEVRKSNQVAQRFYEKNLFKEISVRKNYYKKPVEDALIMRYIMRKKEENEKKTYISN